MNNDAFSVLLQIFKAIMEWAAKCEDRKMRDKQFKKEHPDKPKKPKITHGRLNEKAYRNMLANEKEFSPIAIDNKKIDEISKALDGIGATYFIGSNNGNTALLLVPKSQTDLANTAIKQVIDKQLTKDPKSLSIKNETKRIEAEDFGLVSDVMEQYDIPVQFFKDKDGKYVGIFPSEYETQYKAALKEAYKIRDNVENIEVTPFINTEAEELANLDYGIREVSSDEELFIQNAIQSEGIQAEFVQHEEKTLLYFPQQEEKRIDSALESYKAALEESEEWNIELSDKTRITLDREKLYKGADGIYTEFNIPGTWKDGGYTQSVYLETDKLRSFNDDKQFEYNIDPEMRYTVKLADGSIAGRSGEELLKSFDRKPPYIGKKTEIKTYGDSAYTIDLYAKGKDKLIQISVDDADKVRTHLIDEGISPKAADKLIADISRKMKDEPSFADKRERYHFTKEKTDVVYASVPNIGSLVAKAKLAQDVVGKAECMGEDTSAGCKTCVYDKESNRYTVVSGESQDQFISAVREKLGCDEPTANRIFEQAKDKMYENYALSKGDGQEGFYNSGKYELRIDSADYNFDRQYERVDTTSQRNNIELARLEVAIDRDTKDTYIYHPEKGITSIPKDTASKDIDTLLTNDYGLSAMSSAMILDSLCEKELAKPLRETVTADGVKVQMLTETYLKVSSGGMSEIMPVSEATDNRLRDMGLSERSVESISYSARKFAEGKTPGKIGMGLDGLKKFAAEKAKETTQGIGKVFTKSKEDISDSIGGDVR